MTSPVTDEANVTEASVSQKAKLAFLQTPEHYPEAPQHVTVIETHMAWVFLSNRFAYKLKKPVRYEFLDFTTVEARHHDCLEELRLNRRLAEDVYLDLVPVTLDSDDKLALAGAGQVVDWLVKMRRLPKERMLDQMIEAHCVSLPALERAITKLAAFYQGAAPVELRSGDYRRRIEERIGVNQCGLLSMLSELPAHSADRIKRICAGQRDFVNNNDSLLAQREAAGRIVEGHGDLRPEHLCLEQEPAIIDCLEFKQEFRLIDPADELAFLAMECEVLGAAELSALIFDAYQRLSDDPVPEHLVYFFKSCRALMRARLTLAHLRDAEVHDPDKWTSRAEVYLETAEQYITKANAIP